jgi:hypothetical protein
MMSKYLSESETLYEDGAPLISNVTPVMVLCGSDYDMGYQYSQQLNQIFGPWALKNIQRNFNKAEASALKAYQLHLEKYSPEFIDMFRGMADGATAIGVNLSYEQLLGEYCSVGIIDMNLPAYPIGKNLQTFSDTESPENQNKKLTSNDCSGFAAWGSTTKDHNLICASSEDHPLRYEFLAIVLPETGNNYIFGMVIMPPLCCHPGMNNKGLSYVHHGAGTDGNEKPGYGVPQCLAVQHTLRFANNADEALSLQLSYSSGIGSARAAGLWADVGGKAFDLECRDPKVARKAGDYGEQDFIYVTNNCIAESLQPFLQNEYGWPLDYIPHGGWNVDDMNSVRRNLCMWNALHNYHGAIDLDFVKMLWRFPSQAPAYPTLEEAEIQLYKNQGAGWDSYIGNLSNQVVGITQPDNGEEGLFHVCTGPVGRRTEPLSAGWHFYPIAATHTFFELQLTSKPIDIVLAAAKRAQYDLYYANKELRKLTYADVPYAPLDAIFNQAAIESQKGSYYLSVAHITKGSESICNHAKALRAFTKCQAYAKQVHESLVPPAAKPEDLGLGEWFGSWGQWERS